MRLRKRIRLNWTELQCRGATEVAATTQTLRT